MRGDGQCGSQAVGDRQAAARRGRRDRRRLAGALPLGPGAAAPHAAARAQMQTLIDSPTGLLNRYALERDLRRELARSVRYRRPVCVVVIAFDEDDTDAVAPLASALRDRVRAGDLAYRVG